MRLAALLVCLTVAAVQPALAANPPATPATPTKDASASDASPSDASPPVRGTPEAAAPASDVPAAASSTAATAASPAATPADADSDAARVEKRMHARGYTTRMQNGEKVFCKREEVLGSRLSGAVHCMTADEARVNESRMQQDEELLRQRVMGSCLPNGTGKGANCGN